jgi:hypothetical protein
VGKWFDDVNVNRVPHGGGVVMVWAGISYGQGTQLNFIDGDLNAQKNHDRILRSIIVHSSASITSCLSMIMHGPMLQGSVHNSWKLSPIEHVWNALD